MWLLFALSAGIASASARTFMKAAAPFAGDRAIVFARYAFAAVPAFLLFLFIDIPPIQPLFVPAVGAASVLDAVALLLMSKALRSSAMAHSVPMLSFTPIFILLTGTVILQEIPTLLGVIGILVIVAGSYVLHLKQDTSSFLQPFKMLVKEKGAKYMLGAALLFSFTAPLFKRAVLASSPLFSMTVSVPLSALFLLLFHLGRGNSLQSLLPSRSTLPLFVGIGISLFFVALTFNLGLSTGLASYVVSIKRFSILFNIILGAVFFQEKKLSKHLLAGAVMVLGAALITLA